MVPGAGGVPAWLSSAAVPHKPAQGQRRGAKRPAARGSRVGRYTPPEAKGRYTPPVPTKVRRSPRWFGALVLALLIGGVVVVLLNYLGLLPGSVSSWYLVGGLLAIFSGFVLATRLR